MTYKYSKEDKKPSKFIKKLVKEEIEDDGSKPDPDQDVEEFLNETDEVSNEETETPEHREERKKELQRRRMESTSKRAIFYPSDY